MKNYLSFLCLAAALLLLFAGCGSEVSSSESISELSNSDVSASDYFSENFDYLESRKSWFDKVVQDFGVADIHDSENLSAEYRVVHTARYHDYRYYSLQIFTDGTGKFTLMEYSGSTMEIVLEVFAELSPDEVIPFMAVIDDNNFYDIPTIHPEEKSGLDGVTVFIEGYDGSRTHFISMWMPDPEYEISIILKAFTTFANSNF